MNPRWTDEEKELLIEYAETMPTTELKNKFFPNKSVKAINRQIEKLRDKGLIGLRTRDALKKAYYGRK